VLNYLDSGSFIIRKLSLQSILSS